MDKFIKIGTIICGMILAGCTSVQPVHPTDTTGWKDLIAKDFSNVEPMKGIWSFDKEGCLVATKDVNILTKDTYENFTLDLEFQLEHGANAGVFLYASNLKDWVPNKMEIQLLDDTDPKTLAYTPYQKNCALYGHQKPKFSNLKPVGEWNHLTIYCYGKSIRIAQNGAFVLEANLDDFKSATINPDGSKAPKLHTRAYCTLPTYGRIGLQGKHEGIATRFRNIKIKEQ